MREQDTSIRHALKKFIEDKFIIGAWLYHRIRIICFKKEQSFIGYASSIIKIYQK